ncbi:MAG: hypothetical protein ABI216_21880 [Devosia sp.]
MITTTLERCGRHLQSGFERVLDRGPDSTVSFVDIVQNFGVRAAALCAREEPQYSMLWREIAGKIAEDSIPYMDSQESLNSLNVAKNYAKGLVSEDDLQAARASATSAANLFPAGSEERLAAMVVVNLMNEDAAFALELVVLGVGDLECIGDPGRAHYTGKQKAEAKDSRVFISAVKSYETKIDSAKEMKVQKRRYRDNEISM